MASFLDISDLTAFASISEEKASQMIDDATALATLIAPCLDSGALTANQTLAVRAILRGAVLRWNEAGTGATVQQSAGPFSQSIDTSQNRRGMFWPAEIEQLQGICSSSGGGKAFSIDTAPTTFGYFGYPTTILGGFDDPAYAGFDNTIYEEQGF